MSGHHHISPRRTAALHLVVLALVLVTFAAALYGVVPARAPRAAERRPAPTSVPCASTRCASPHRR